MVRLILRIAFLAILTGAIVWYALKGLVDLFLHALGLNPLD